MAENLKNLLFADGNWLIEVAAENHADLEPYLNNESNQSQENEHKFKLPDTIGILPIRNAVAFPPMCPIERASSRMMWLHRRSRTGSRTR